MSDDHLRKLIELGYQSESSDYNRVNLDAAIERTGLCLPEDYLAFLRAFPNSGYFRGLVVFSGGPSTPGAEDGQYPVSELFALSIRPGNDLFESPASHLDLPPSFLAIGDDDFGNYYCMDLDRANFGQVHVVLHEEDERNRFLIAPDFSQWLRGFGPHI